MKKILVAVLILIACSLPAFCFEYYAEIEQYFKEQKITQTNRMWISDGKARAQTVIGNKKGNIFIDRNDKKAMWTLLEKEKAYFSGNRPAIIDPLGERGKAFINNQMKSSKLVGNEVVAGVKCKKYMFVVPMFKLTYYYYLSGDNIIMKYESPMERYEVVKYVKGKQNPSLFEIPRGYKEILQKNE